MQRVIVLAILATVCGCGAAPTGAGPGTGILDHGAGGGPAGAAADPCGALVTPAAAPAAIALGGRNWTMEGGVLRTASLDDDRVARLGVLSDVAGSTEDDLAALGVLVDALRARGADALVAPGGWAAGDAAAVARVLARAGVPVFLGAGASETPADLDRATAAAPGLAFALPRVRRVEGDDFTLVPVRGHPVARARRAGACPSGPEAIADAAAAAHGAPEPRVAVSHAPPRTGGKAGIDLVGESATGDPRLARFMADSGVRFGLFGGTVAGAAAASALAGAAVPPGTWSADLLVAAGSVDSVAAAAGPAGAGGTAVASLVELTMDGPSAAARYEAVVPAAGVETR